MSRLPQGAVQLRGVENVPMLMHSDILANPIRQETIDHKTLTSKRKKTYEDQLQIAHSEWKHSLYQYNGKIVVPVINVRKMLIEGARLRKLGKQIERGVIMMTKSGTTFPLQQYDPKKFMDNGLIVQKNIPSIEEMWNRPNEYVDDRSVGIRGSRIVRYRPKFLNWLLNVSFYYNPEVIDYDDIIISFKHAGERIGLGDFRPLMGRFEVKEISISE